jgi:hypothetical protein
MVPCFNNQLATFNYTIMTWLLILKFFVFLGWQNVTSEQIKQEVFQLTKDFQVLDFQLCINNTSPKHFTKNTLQH